MGRIKICGLRREEDIRYVNEFVPDFAGFVFAPTRRQVSIEEAVRLRRQMRPEITAVGVFVNSPSRVMAECVERGAIEWIQLHGDENAGVIHELRGLTDAKIVRAVRVRTEDDIRRADSLPCDYLLLDTYSKDAYGGTGKTFSWEMIPDDLSHPWFLAGGIDEGNIERALDTGCYAVDVSSAAETDGYKDRAKIERLVGAVR